jgi:acyl-CoA synthetase (AMP-forming)/AMP-acid ligase II/NAD(P)-dependent dehydrogenase (short-subunit alcohol dehydrogenase family)
MSELLPRPVRLLLGATSRGVSDARLREAVEGRVVLVTGASSGVGRASALRLGTAGARVVLVARRAELLEEVRDEILAGGGSAFVHPADLADFERVGELAAEVLEQHGHVDVVVSNAGLSIRRWISQSYDRFHDFQRTINVNYLGPVRLLLGLLPSMRERGSGHIVNVATMGVDFPAMRWSAYIASKAAFEAWLGGAAPEIRADGVTTTSIHLQLVRSPMLGPFRIWNYVPGMSTEEAAAIVARAIVERPRTIAPPWARIAGPFNQLAQAQVEAALVQQARRANRDTRERVERERLQAGRRARLPLPPPLGAALEQSSRIAGEALGSVTTIAASRAVRPVRPDRVARALASARSFGPTPAFAAAAAAELYGDRAALFDERGMLTFAELDVQSRRLASSLHRHLDLGARRCVAIMCRNHRGFVLAAVAAARLGCDVVPLNTDFAGPQLADVLAREGVTVAVYDDEFEPLFDAASFGGERILARHAGAPARPTLAALIDVAAGEAPRPRSPGHTIMLTSGTTGTPKGARRTVRPLSFAPLAPSGLLDLARIKPTPRSGAALVLCPPLFHLYGQVGMMAAFAFGSPVVLRSRFDADAALAQVDRHRAEMLFAVPTMLARIMDLPEEVRDSHDTSSLRLILSGAAPLPPALASAVMDEFGEILYNAYASTEAGGGTLATPADLREAPGTVGRPAGGVTVKVLDDEGLELPSGRTGRVFVGGPLLFEGYTGGGGKQLIDGLLHTGDLGHFDEQGRLFIDGRDDDMIVSGGENVFPQEVEELLTAHPAIADAAVFGVPDEHFGQRLAALAIPAAGGTVSAEELQQYVAAHLARYKVPREIVFVAQLPRTASGKLRRRDLATELRRAAHGD